MELSTYNSDNDTLSSNNRSDSLVSDSLTSDTLASDTLSSDYDNNSPNILRKGRKQTHRSRRIRHDSPQSLKKTVTNHSHHRDHLLDVINNSLANNSLTNNSLTNKFSPDTSYDSDNSRIRSRAKTRNRYVPDKEYMYFYETTLDTIHKNANRAINSNNASKVFRTDLTREISSYMNPGDRKSTNSVKVPIVERTHPTTGAVVRLPAYVPYKSDVGYNWTTSYGKVKVDKNGKITIPWNHDGFRYVKFTKSNDYLLQPIHTGYPSILPTSKSHTVRASKPRYKKTKTIIKKR